MPARRHATRMEHCLDWLEYLFWLIPVGFVALCAASGALAAYLFSSLLTVMCRNVAGLRRYKHFKLDRSAIKLICHSQSTEATPLAISYKNKRSLIVPRHPGADCGSSILLKRTGRSGYFRMGRPSYVPIRGHNCRQDLGVGRFPGAAHFNRMGLRRF